MDGKTVIIIVLAVLIVIVIIYGISGISGGGHMTGQTIGSSATGNLPGMVGGC